MRGGAAFPTGVADALDVRVVGDVPVEVDVEAAVLGEELVQHGHCLVENHCR